MPQEPHLRETLQDTAERHDAQRHDVVYKGMVWNIVSDTFDYNDEPLTREYVDHPGAVAVVARNAQGEIATIRQYRRPAKQRMIEIPAGLLDVEGEEPLAAAKRELMEEASLVAETWTPLVTFFSTPGGSNEVIHIFLADGAKAGTSDFVREAEEADIEMTWIPETELLDGILHGRLHSPTLVVGLLALAAKQHA